MFTGLPLYIGTGALVVILVLSGALWVEHGRLEAAQETIAAKVSIIDSWEAKGAEQSAKLAELRQTIADLNAVTDANAEAGRLAAERQRTIDRMMAERARADAELRLVSDRYRKLRESLVDAPLCETYEAVLVAVAGGTP